MTTLKISPGLDGLPTNTIPDDPQAFVTWFKSVGIKRWLANADTRNAISGPGISITGDISSPATVSVSNELASLFAQPYVIVGAPVSPANLTDYRSLAVQSGVLALTDGGAKGAITVGVTNNGIGNAQIRQGAAASIVGNSTASLANVADIAAGADNTALVRTGGTLSFSALPIAAIASIANNTVLGNISGGALAPAALTQTQLTALIDLATMGASGAMPQLDGNTAHFLNGNGAYTTPAYPTGANPSAKVGLAAVNGTATTWMRSDASPAIDQTIAPTWMAQHIFTPGSAVEAIIINGYANAKATRIYGSSTTGESYGLYNAAGTNSSDTCAEFANAAHTLDYLQIAGDGGLIVGAPTGTTKGVGTVNATKFYVNGVAQPVFSAAITGYGTPTGGSHQSSFAAGSITLANLAAAVAQLIVDLKTQNVIAA